jgi:hypothetical protein
LWHFPYICVEEHGKPEETSVRVAGFQTEAPPTCNSCVLLIEQTCSFSSWWLFLLNEQFYILQYVAFISSYFFLQDICMTLFSCINFTDLRLLQQWL